MFPLCSNNIKQIFRFVLKPDLNIEIRRWSRNGPSRFTLSRFDDARYARYLKKTADLVAGNGEKDKSRNSKNLTNMTEAFIYNTIPNNPYNNKIANKLPKCDNPRLKQLGSVFFEHIANILRSGEVCSDLLELGFEVTQVTVAPDFSSVIVSWLATEIDKDEKILEFLPKCSSELRSALVSMRVVGNVPQVLFHKDSSRMKVADVERLLSIADMGPEQDRLNEEGLSEEEGVEIEGSYEEVESSESVAGKLAGPRKSSKYWKESSMKTSTDVYGLDYERMKMEVLNSKNKVKKKLTVESAFDKRVVEIDIENN